MVSNALFEYAVKIRRELHEYPEIGFDLPRTVSVVKRELDAMGVEYSEAFAPCSVVAYLGHDDTKKTLGIRADMDALPVEEKNDLPFKSKVPGQMHACGHDSHTAMLLALIKALVSEKEELPYNLRFFFQPSEECALSGAKVMSDNGCMDGVDLVLCTHNEAVTMEVGKIGAHSGPYMAACMPITVKFYGKTAHATLPKFGVDAIKMAVDAYTEMKELVAKEYGDEPYIFSVGQFNGGTAHNVIADYCELSISFRYFNQKFADQVIEKVTKVAENAAERIGGRAEVLHHVSSNVTTCDPALFEKFAAIIKADKELEFVEVPYRLSSEDFNWYTRFAPGLIFRFGVKNNAMGANVAAHSNYYKLDEEGIKYGLQAFLDFVKTP